MSTYHELEALAADPNLELCASCNADAKVQAVQAGLVQVTIYHDDDCPEYQARLSRRERRRAKRGKR